MEATLKYNLPDEEEDFKKAVRAMDYYLIIEEIKAYIRRKTKYGETSDDTFEEFHNILQIIGDLD